VVSGEMRSDLPTGSACPQFPGLIGTNITLGAQVRVIEFTSDDVVRNIICRDRIVAFEKDR